jgi:hypothetical protein
MMSKRKKAMLSQFDVAFLPPTRGKKIKGEGVKIAIALCLLLISKLVLPHRTLKNHL